MAVITISRGSFSGGKMLADCITDTLNYRCINRDVIVEKASSYGVTQEELRETLDKPPGFWDRFKHRKYVYLTLIQAALTEEVRQGKVVYHGNAGHLLLKGPCHVLRTRIIAPVEFRISMVQDRLKYSRNEALDYIHRVDADRRKWTQYLYGVDWGDPSLYDVVLNLECMDLAEACETISAMTKLGCFQETPESQVTMDNLALACKVRAAVVVNSATSVLEVEVAASNGVITIKGKATSNEQSKAIDETVRKVPGVTDLRLEVFTGVDI
jgi:cytidylate kinase